MNKFPENITLKTSDGGTFALSDFVQEHDCVIVIYPKMGASGKQLPSELCEVEGMTGCTPQNRAYAAAKAHFDELGYALIAVGTHASLAEQAEFKSSVGADYTFLNDSEFALENALGLPTFRTGDGRKFYFRHTLIVHAGKLIASYQVAHPEQDAANVIDFIENYHEGHF